MKLMKSFLTLLLLGGMTFAGCDKAKSGNEPAGETPSGETPSGETPSGETPSGSGDSTPSGGGDTTPPSGGGDTTPPSGGGDTTPPSGGGDDSPVSNFDNKVLTVETVASDVDHNAAVQAMYADAYVAFFEEGKVVELVRNAGSYKQVMIGKYTESGNTAQLAIERMYSQEDEEIFDVPADYLDLYKYEITYSSETSKYTTSIKEYTSDTEFYVVDFECVASASEPTHFPTYCPPYVMHGMPGAESWSITEFVSDATTEHPEQKKCVLNLAKDEEFVFKVGPASYVHYESSEGALDHKLSGHMVVMGSGEESAHNFKVLEEGEYTVVTNNGGVQIYHERVEAQVNYKFRFFDSFATEAGAELFAWVWGDDGANSHFVKLTIEQEGDFKVANVALSNLLYNIQIVRVNPGATHKPVDNGEEFTTEMYNELWNWTDDFHLNGIGETKDILLNNHH